MVQLMKKILKQTARHMQVMAKNDDLFFEGNKTVFRSRGALGYFLGGYVPPGTRNWHPVLKKKSPKIDTPF